MTRLWYALRSLVFYVGYALIMVLQPLVGILLYYLLPSRWLRAWLVSACRVAVWWARVSCGIRYRVEGMENIPAGACVVLAKHQSAWETLFLQAYLEPTTTVAKRELLRIPFFGWGMALTNPIAIDRDKPAQALKDVIRQGGEQLAAGKRVIIFPEGTRTLPGEQREYSAGGAMLAVKSNVSVLPVALNSAACWPRGTLIKKPGLIRVVFGAPIVTQGRSTKVVNEEARVWIESTSAALLTNPGPVA